MAGTSEPENTIEPKPGSTIQSVEASWRLLDLLGRSHIPTGVTELAKTLGEPKAKIHRHLTTLKRLGVVEQIHGGDRYRLGWKLYQLGQVAFEHFDLKTIAEPFMARLRDEATQSVLLAIPTGIEGLLIANVDYAAAGQPKISGVPGTVVPPGVSSTGRIILAFAKPAQQNEVLAAPLKAYTRRSITDPATIKERLQQIRERLYDYASEELTLGISTVAAPILDGNGRLLGIVSIVGSVQFIADPPSQLQIEQVQRCAAAISARFASTAYEDLSPR
ncbi:MAG TPA: IclR family transcriptional regulator [Steroidobacter sp.]|uniref:IclR family transcriptional regulator n=1 Tax=Steroidobacter sp. TaxID=1978227 RepID=UPI002EDB4080